MDTIVAKPTEQVIEKACEILRNGDIVAIPTETVYGLAGDASNADAIKKIFTAKGRPQDNPLIVHISNMDMLNKVVSQVSQDAMKLANAFWPGPLTIIMPKSKYICDETCAGLDSVGVRMPSNEIARKIIEISQIPFAAPSANISGRPSPTTAEDVFADMNGKISLIIDGGECSAGVESTVVSCLNDTPIILRPGVITKEQMELVLGHNVEIAKEVLNGVNKDSKVLSPGMKYKHYSPNADITIVKGTLDNFAKYVNGIKDNDVYIMCFDGENEKFVHPSISYGPIDQPQIQTHKLFSVLRQLDRLGAKVVYARCPDTNGVALAVYNRLIRAAGFKIIDV